MMNNSSVIDDEVVGVDMNGIDLLVYEVVVAHTDALATLMREASSNDHALDD